MDLWKQAANLLTLCRLLGSLGLLAFPAFSPGFWALYLFCGLTDMADGPVARRTGSASASGARLDTAAVQEGRVLRGGMQPIPPAGEIGGKQRGGDDP